MSDQQNQEGIEDKTGHLRDLDFQLIRARKQFGMNSCILHECKVFNYEEGLFTLLTVGGEFVNKVQFNSCYFGEMPINFFDRLLEEAKVGTSADQIVEEITFKSNDKKKVPEEVRDSPNWSMGEGKEVLNLDLINSVSQTKFKVKIICEKADRRTKFKTFRLVRVEETLAQKAILKTKNALRSMIPAGKFKAETNKNTTKEAGTTLDENEEEIGKKEEEIGKKEEEMNPKGRRMWNKLGRESLKKWEEMRRKNGEQIAEEESESAKGQRRSAPNGFKYETECPQKESCGAAAKMNKSMEE